MSQNKHKDFRRSMKKLFFLRR